MNKRIILCIAVAVLFVGQVNAGAGAATRLRRSIAGSKALRMTKATRKADQKSAANRKLPENLDKAYGPSILVDRFDPIAGN